MDVVFTTSISFAIFCSMSLYWPRLESYPSLSFGDSTLTTVKRRIEDEDNATPRSKKASPKVKQDLMKHFLGHAVCQILLKER